MNMVTKQQVTTYQWNFLPKVILGPHFRNQTICLCTGSMAFTVSATCCEF